MHNILAAVMVSDRLGRCESVRVSYMLFYIVLRRLAVGPGDRRHPMWIIEVNFVGHQITHRVPDRRRPIFRFSPRSVHWRPSQVRRQRAA